MGVFRQRPAEKCTACGFGEGASGPRESQRRRRRYGARPRARAREREREKDRKREGGTESAAHHYAVRFCFVVLTSMMEVLGIGRLVSLVG